MCNLIRANPPSWLRSLLCTFAEQSVLSLHSHTSTATKTPGSLQHYLYVAWPIICHSCMELGSLPQLSPQVLEMLGHSNRKIKNCGMDNFSWPKCWLFFPYLTSHLKLFQYLGFRAEPRDLSNFLPFSYLFICSILHASICWVPLLNHSGERHYQMWWSYSTTENWVYLSDNFWYLVPICLFYRVDSNYPWLFLH